jgi:hypothetical protein
MRIIQSMACNNFVNLFGFKPLDTGKTCKAMRTARQRANIWLIVVGQCHFATGDVEFLFKAISDGRLSVCFEVQILFTRQISANREVQVYW